MSALNVACLQDAIPIANGQSVFGVKLGKDLSDNFALTFTGLAVRAPDGRLYQFAKDNPSAPLADVTGLTISSSKPVAYRIPVSTVEVGAILVTSDEPFAVLFVQEVVSPTHIRGIDPFRQEQVDYVVPSNIFSLAFFVRVVSIFDLFGGAGGGIFGTPPGGASAFNPLLFLLLARGDSDKRDKKDSLALLAALSQTGGGAAPSNIALLALLLDDIDPLLLLALQGFGAPPSAPPSASGGPTGGAPPSAPKSPRPTP